MSATVFSLPIPLILLIHLHILEYPHANKPEYDHNVFEPNVRGLKERTKLLEDISYFLVGRLEGSAKAILGTYPCAAPSDTLAFRTSLSKYLETLRHNSVFPSSKPSAGTAGVKSKAKEPTKAPNHIVAWWWKDVVVRKSLLEECAGERFERLLLSVSTHALLKSSMKMSSPVDLENLNTILRSQPAVYANLLKKYKTARQAWAQSASLLLQREMNLRTLRDHLGRQRREIVSKYSSIPTERFMLLVGSKRDDLRRTRWSSSEGKVALEFLEKAANIDQSLAISQTVSDDTSLFNSIANMKASHSSAPAQPQPLPMAAAHHPAYLKKIRKPVFPTNAPLQPSAPSNETPGPGYMISHRAALALKDRREAEARMQRSLTEALARIRKIGGDLREQMKALEKKRQTKAASKKKTNTTAGVVMDLWEPEIGMKVNFQTEPTPELLASFSLQVDEKSSGLEARIDKIRDTLLPAYPPLPDLHTPRLPHIEPEPETSKIPRAGDSQQINGRTVQPQKPVAKMARGDKDAKRPGCERKDVGAKTPKAEAEVKKANPRKSIRVSLALHAQQRPSLFPVILSSDEAPATEIIDDIHDISIDMPMDDDAADTLYATTPKLTSKTPRTVKVNRIFTSTKALGGIGSRPPKESFPGVFEEPTVPLPSLVDMTSEGLESDAWSSDADGEEIQGLDEGYGQEGNSMTLKEILLSANTNDYTFLIDGGEEDEIGNESFNWG